MLRWDLPIWRVVKWRRVLLRKIGICWIPLVVHLESERFYFQSGPRCLHCEPFTVQNKFQGKKGLFCTWRGHAASLSGVNRLNQDNSPPGQQEHRLKLPRLLQRFTPTRLWTKLPVAHKQQWSVCTRDTLNSSVTYMKRTSYCTLLWS